MVLPIYVYGQPVLREPTQDVTTNSDELQQLIDDMIETMRAAPGIGLAAPQIGRTERLFVVDLSTMEDELDDLPTQPMVFINPEIVEETEMLCDYEEGCLSIPDIQELVERPEAIRIRYLDRDFEEQELAAGGMLARVIQHEYDHVEGVLFIDHISAFRRRLLRRRLREIAKGQIDAEYPLAVAS